MSSPDLVRIPDRSPHEGRRSHECAVGKDSSSKAHCRSALVTSASQDMTSAFALMNCDMVQALHGADNQSEGAQQSQSEEEEELPPFLSDVEAVEVGRECLSLASFVP